MTELFYTDISEAAARYEEGISLLSEAQRGRIGRCGGEKQRGMLAAALLLRYCLGAETASQVRRTDAGKPYLPGGPHFSLSYSGNIAVLLLDQGECGVDTEPLDGTGRREPAAVLTDSERLWLQDQVHNYMTLWTRKEAVLKAYGDVDADPAGFSVLEHSNSVTRKGRQVYIGSYSAGGNVVSWAAEQLCIPPQTHLGINQLLNSTTFRYGG